MEEAIALAFDAPLAEVKNTNLLLGNIGETAVLAYIDQSRTLDPNKSIWEEISGGADLLKIGAREVNSRAYVGRFNFSGTDQQKKVKP